MSNGNRSLNLENHIAPAGYVAVAEQPIALISRILWN